MLASVIPSSNLRSFNFDHFGEPHRTCLLRVEPELNELWSLLGDDDRAKKLFITHLMGTHHLDVERVVLPYLQQIRWWKQPLVQQVHRQSSESVRDWLLGEKRLEYIHFFNSLDQPQLQFLQELLDWASMPTKTSIPLTTRLERLKTMELSPVISKFYVWHRCYEEDSRKLDSITSDEVDISDLWSCPRLK